MQILENISLKSYNSFGIGSIARKMGFFTDTEQLQSMLGAEPNMPVMVLGGGSNILFTGNFNGLVLKNDINGISLIKEDDRHVYVKVGAGENWHQFVLYCLSRHWAGIENLSLIPGNVGASPMQNIGAYGVELREVFDELEAFHLKEKKIRVFSVNDCRFGYRDSVFKQKLKDQYVILSVTFRLNKSPIFNTSYGAIEEELQKMGVQQLSIEAISQAVIRIRSSKLPDPLKIGNAGSFFKNPIVPKTRFADLRNQFPTIVGYENFDGTMKLAAGWRISKGGCRLPCQPGPGTGQLWTCHRQGDLRFKRGNIAFSRGKIRGKTGAGSQYYIGFNVLRAAGIVKSLSSKKLQP